MDSDAATGNFGLVGRTISVGSASITVVPEFSAQATGIAGPRDRTVAGAIRDHTAAVASHLERTLQSAARDLSDLVVADGPAFVQALTEAGFVRTEYGAADVKVDESRTIAFPPVTLSGPGRPVAEVAPESQVFRHLVLRVRPKGESPTAPMKFNAHVSDDDVIQLERQWLAHGLPSQDR